MKIFFVFSRDKRSDDVKEWIGKVNRKCGIEVVGSAKKADVIIVVSGDGAMLHAINKYYSLNKLFFGVNRGTVGFLLNPVKTVKEFLKIFKNFGLNNIIQSKLIKATFITENKKREQVRYAFNDVYLNARHGSSISGLVKTKKSLNGKFSGDGIIIATPQGSTAYNRAAGGSILPLGHDIFAVTSNNPSTIRTSVAFQEIVVEVTRGMAIGHADNKRVTKVRKVIIKPTDINVRLVFKRGYDFEGKRYNIK